MRTEPAVLPIPAGKAVALVADARTVTTAVIETHSLRGAASNQQQDKMQNHARCLPHTPTSIHHHVLSSRSPFHAPRCRVPRCTHADFTRSTRRSSCGRARYAQSSPGDGLARSPTFTSSLCAGLGAFLALSGLGASAAAYFSSCTELKSEGPRLPSRARSDLA